MNPSKLSDVNLDLDGLTQDDIVNERKAVMEIIKDAAAKGNTSCFKTVLLDELAKSYGLDMNYSEELTDDDFGGMY